MKQSGRRKITYLICWRRWRRRWSWCSSMCFLLAFFLLLSLSFCLNLFLCFLSPEFSPFWSLSRCKPPCSSSPLGFLWIYFDWSLSPLFRSSFSQVRLLSFFFRLWICALKTKAKLGSVGFFSGFPSPVSVSFASLCFLLSCSSPRFFSPPPPLRPSSGFYKAREGLVSLPPEMAGIVEARDHGQRGCSGWIFPWSSAKMMNSRIQNGVTWHGKWQIVFWSLMFWNVSIGSLNQ